MNSRTIIYSLAALALSAATACTNLDETLYSKVASDNFYNTKSDIERAVGRPFEHAFATIQERQVLQELTADQLITPVRDGWWDDGGRWRRYHYHTWTLEDSPQILYLWNGQYQGIGQCNWVIEDLESLDPAKFGYTEAEFNDMKAQCRTLRAMFYLTLLDAFRNCPLVVSFYDQSKNTKTQVEPKVLFNFIESELKECIRLLGTKEALGAQASVQGKWTKASAAALLVRLYLNAKVYIEEDRFKDCAIVCQDILDGKYGPYKVADTWDAAFDWNNNTCDEVIFGYPASSGYSYWHYSGEVYWYAVPSQAKYYLKDSKCKAGEHNVKYGASPSYNVDGTLYDYKLGMPVQNFRKYPGDERMKLYRNLGNSRREGMFLFGYLEYVNDNGKTARVRAPERPYDLYIRDAVGNFQGMAPDSWPTGQTSSLTNGDHNSGWHFVKYPMYMDSDEHQLESDYTEIRLPEIIYSLAECKLRSGDTEGAAELLNGVRKRNYPAENLEEVLYQPDGSAVLDMDEMLAEWGREFFAEARRRTDLIRFGKFSSGTWWDKTPDADRHTEIFPLVRAVLDTNPDLKQNPGYNK